MCILDRPNASLILPFFDSIPLLVNRKPGFEKQLDQCLLRRRSHVLNNLWFSRLPASLPCVESDVVEVNKGLRDISEETYIVDDRCMAISEEQFLRDLLINIFLEVKPASLGFNNALVHSATRLALESDTRCTLRRVRLVSRPGCEMYASDPSLLFRCNATIIYRRERRRRTRIKFA